MRVVCDTCVWARVFLQDDEDQVIAAASFIGVADHVYVPMDVFRELGWLLSRAKAWPREEVVRRLAGWVALDHARFEDPVRARRAVAYFRDGLDWGDALLSAGVADADSWIVTFDERFVKRGRELDLPVTSLDDVLGSDGEEGP